MSNPAAAKPCGAALVALAIGAALSIPHARADDGTKPGDAALTCEQIAAELAPYARQMIPNLQALGASQQQLYEQARAMSQQRQAEHAMLAPMATAGALDPTGASKRAYAMAAAAQAAKEKAESEALASSPLAQQNRAQSEQLAAQGKEMQSDARLRRLMQLGQEKHCDKR